MKLTDTEKKVAAQMGITPEVFAASKTSLAARDMPEGEEPADGEEAEPGADDVEALKERVAELEAENEELRTQLDEQDQDAEDEEAAAEGEEDEEIDAEGEDEEEDAAPSKGKAKPAKTPPAKGAPKGKPAPKPKGKPSAEVARLKAELKKRDVIAAVDAASRAGKVPPAKRAQMVALGMKIGVEALNVTLGAMPKAAPTRAYSKIDAGTTAGAEQMAEAQAIRRGVAGLSKVELAVCKQTGCTPEAFVRSKLDLEKQDQQRAAG